MSKALRFLQITAEHQDCPSFSVCLTIKTSCQNISITRSQISLKRDEHRSGYGACAFDILRHKLGARNSIPLYHTLRKNRLDQKLNKNDSLILPKKTLTSDKPSCFNHYSEKAN